jgi:hypothetical protein
MGGAPKSGGGVRFARIPVACRSCRADTRQASRALPKVRETLDEARHFANWFKALVIGSLDIPITPPKGWSNSRIRNLAPETAKAESSNAIMAVGLDGASTLKPRKIITSQRRE